MKYFVTEIKALDPRTGELKTFIGPRIKALNFKDAEIQCQTKGLGYCKVVGHLVKEIPTKKGLNTPDWDRSIDYDNLHLN